MRLLPTLPTEGEYVADLERRVEQLTCELETSQRDNRRLEMELSIARAQYLATEPDGGPCCGVYFLAHGGFIKIGWSRDVRRRPRDFQLPTAPVGLGWIPQETAAQAETLERALHQEFFCLREHGEWFRDAGPIRACIADSAQPWPEALKCPQESNATRG